MSNRFKYVAGVGKLWGQKISGPVFAIFSIILAIAGPFIADAPTAIKIARLAAAWLTGGAAILMIFVAQYTLWDKERRLREEESAKNQRPEIKGEASGFEIKGSKGHGHSQGNWSAHAQFMFRLLVCNQREVTTNIIEIRLDGSALQPRVAFDCCKIETPIGLPPDLQLEHGIGKQFHVYSDATVQGCHLDEVGKINLDQLGIIVIDGFGGKHVILVKHGEELAF